MGNVRTKYLIPMLVVGIIIPNLVFAAWWNPFSWFQNNTELIPTETSQPRTTENNTDDIPVVQESKEVTERQEKVVEKVIKVDNPELQTKIDKLIAENSALSKEIYQYKLQVSQLTSSNTSLVSRINQCRDELSSAKQTTTVINVDSETLAKKRQLEALDAKLLPMLETVGKITDGYGNYESVPKDNWNSLPSPEDVNFILDAYKAIDPSFKPEKVSGAKNVTLARQLDRLLADLRGYIGFRKLLNEI